MPTSRKSTFLPLKVNDELRAITMSCESFDSAVMMSSEMPSAKYSCSGSPLMLANGRTAIDAAGLADNDEARSRASDIGRPDPRGEDSQWPCDILERLFPQVDELDFDTPAHVVVRRTRDGDASGLGDALEPRRDIDAVAKHVVPVDQDVAEMNADPVHDVVGPRRLRVALGHLFLHRERAFDGGDDRGELDQHPVAHRLEESPAVRRDDRRRRLAPLTHRFRRPRLVLAHHARIADDVGGEDRGQLAGGAHRADVTLSAGRIAGRPCPRARSARGGS